MGKGFKLKTTGKKAVDEVPYGTYVYRTAEGEYLGDGEGRLMCHFGFRNDREIIAKMVDAAKHYGFEGGSVEFWSGHRPVSDEEYSEQETRQKLGLIPDPLDYGAMMDELKGRRNG